MRNATEMLAEGLAMYPALFLYPWVLAWVVGIKNSGSQSEQIPYDIPVVRLYDFSHPNEIPEKDCPFAIDGERYYFTKQVRRDASGNRSQRKAGEQGAYWKSTSRDIDIKDLDEKLIGYMRKYALYEEDCKRSANWYMEEYRVHYPDHELVIPYVLCKIYDKDSFCPKYTDTSIPALRERIIKRQLGSHPNQSQTQFDGSDSHEDIIMQPPSSNFPPESIPPTSGSPSDNEVFPMLHGLSNEFSMSRDPSGNLNPPESIPSNPWNSNPMNQSQTQSDDYNSVENFLSDSGCPTSSLDSYSNDQYGFMMDGIFNGPSMPHYFSGNLNAVDGEESSLDCFSQSWHH